VLVALTLPADPAVLRVARLAASGLASIGGFDLDEIEDVRIGIDELCTAMVAVAPGAPIGVNLRLDDRAIEVEASVDAPDGITEVLRANPLTDQLLNVVTDDHGWSWSQGRLTAHLRKQSAPRRLAAVPT
jgi:anti-sigma regulatory factor (Ser/Thr protein kinase)